MTYSEYAKAFNAAYRTAQAAGANYRLGQAAFNQLVTDNPQLAESIRGDVELDPFYDDNKLTPFLYYVEAQWQHQIDTEGVTS